MDGRGDGPPCGGALQRAGGGRATPVLRHPREGFLAEPGRGPRGGAGLPRRPVARHAREAAARDGATPPGGVSPHEHGPRRHGDPGWAAQGPDRLACQEPATRRSGRGPHAPSRVLVQPGVPRTAAHRLGNAGCDPGEADHVRGRPRDTGVSGPEASPGARPALLRLLPPRAARRSPRVRGSGVRGRASVGGGTDPRDGKRRGRPEKGALRGLLLDHELPTRAQGHLLRQLPHQAGCAGSPRGASQPASLRHALALAGLPRVAARPVFGRRDRGRTSHPVRGGGGARCDARRDAREPLEALAAHYLAHQWDNGHTLDPVARFHLGNGARLERINWLADPSAKGLRQSLGLMVNYVYDLDDVERNHERYVNSHVVACSPAVERLARLVDAEASESLGGASA
ncbi:MAG: malonyl-CoA decarboxylase family protein [Betaproteobacteria bacterium]|nr:malonyl-CoA decarboxylase family protein [Betaproteobacteria bacterium]